jgi:hypothetical protein
VVRDFCRRTDDRRLLARRGRPGNGRSRRRRHLRCGRRRHVRRRSRRDARLLGRGAARRGVGDERRRLLGHNRLPLPRMQKDGHDGRALHRGLTKPQQRGLEVAQISGSEFGRRSRTKIERLRRCRHGDEFGAERRPAGIPRVAGAARRAKHPSRTGRKHDDGLVAVRQHVQDLTVERKVIDEQIDRVAAGFDLETDRVAFAQNRVATRQAGFDARIRGNLSRADAVEREQCGAQRPRHDIDVDANLAGAGDPACQLHNSGPVGFIRHRYRYNLAAVGGGTDAQRSTIDLSHRIAQLLLGRIRRTGCGWRRLIIGDCRQGPNRQENIVQTIRETIRSRVKNSAGFSSADRDGE